MNLSHAEMKLRYRIAGNFQGRKLSRIGRKGALNFCGIKLSQNVKTGCIMGVVCLKFHEENFPG